MVLRASFADIKSLFFSNSRGSATAIIFRYSMLNSRMGANTFVNRAPVVSDCASFFNMTLTTGAETISLNTEMRCIAFCACCFLTRASQAASYRSLPSPPLKTLLLSELFCNTPIACAKASMVAAPAWLQVSIACTNCCKSTLLGAKTTCRTAAKKEAKHEERAWLRENSIICCFCKASSSGSAVLSRS